MFRIGEGRGKWIYFFITYFFFFDGIEKKKNYFKRGSLEVGREKKKRRTARRGNKWSGGRGESLGCNLFCSELGKEGESGYIYFIISMGTKRKKNYFKQGRWKLEEKKKRRQGGQLEEVAWMKVEPSVFVRMSREEMKERTIKVVELKQ